MARILVIDDENNIRTMVSLALEQAGHTVDSAADGPEGLAKFRETPGYDLVLLDQRMPGMEGIEVLRELRRLSSSARIIMITAFGTIDLAVDAMKAGATDFLRKPFTIDTLRGAVQSSLTVSTAERGERPAPSVVYWTAGVNGFHVEARPGAPAWDNGDMVYALTIRDPSGTGTECSVIVPEHVAEQVEILAGLREAADQARFWRILSEHVATSYLWQNAEIPAGKVFRLDGMNKDLAGWIDSLPLG